MGNQHVTTHIQLSTLVTIAEEEYRTLHRVQKEESFITLKIQYLLKRIIKLPLIAVVITVSMSTHSIDITQQGMPLPDLNSTSLCEHDQNMDVSEGETLFPDLNSTEITQNDYLSSINTMNTLEQEVTEESLGEVQSNDEHKVSSVNFVSLLIMWFSTFLLLTHALTSL